jgi:hypothetical protein
MPDILEISWRCWEGVLSRSGETIYSIPGAGELLAFSSTKVARDSKKKSPL